MNNFIVNILNITKYRIKMIRLQILECLIYLLNIIQTYLFMKSYSNVNYFGNLANEKKLNRFCSKPVG